MFGIFIEGQHANLNSIEANEMKSGDLAVILKIKILI